MCLGIPAKVIEVRGDVGIVEFGGVRKEVDASLIDVKPGDYVIVHAGAMISRLSPEEAKETIKLWEEVIRKLEEA
ncbi:MAG: HypC/HybG/HupF family hydrogenase formation chaperone [Thermoproteota archaeon]|nr:MAG: HypC/HybG/HupF family hydrogenase formation chaperone [Candidatus Korarchaeota archaeon]RLG50112.1 MAG: HypC/HybG/HupF family hydrogenase formation chaperone [Candidatus Korarchaeota archaeon]